MHERGEPNRYTGPKHERHIYFSGGKIDVSLVQLRLLHQPDDVAICVFYRCNQLTTTDIYDLLLCLCASV